MHTDFPERFAERKQLSGLARDGGRRELHLEEHWFHKGGVVLKFAGVNSISEAELLAGMELQVPAEQREKLEPGAAYVSDVVGCQLWIESPDGPRLLGAVAEVQFGAGEAPLLLVKDGTHEFLLPYAEEFVKLADFARHRIEMTVPEGLLELEAPLSAEEGERQKAEANEAREGGVRRERRK